MTHATDKPRDRRPIRIGISSCLLGAKVRYDGDHKLDPYVARTLGQYFEFVPVCPEVAIGMGVPRAPIRLTGNPRAPRAVGVDDPTLDVTDRLAAYGAGMAEELADISGYILKSRSPSCGMERVKVYTAGGRVRYGTGVYAAALTAARPLLPVEEEGRLGEPALRESFITRVLAYRRWQALLRRGLTPARLVEFHSAHKLVLMAHSPLAYRRLGRLVAFAGSGSLQRRATRYIEGFMEGLRHPATRARHVNALMHLMGYLKKRLAADDKAELLELIGGYRRGALPLIVPLTLLRHHFRRCPDPYALRQVYLEPYPPQIVLRDGP